MKSCTTPLIGKQPVVVSRLAGHSEQQQQQQQELDEVALGGATVVGGSRLALATAAIAHAFFRQSCRLADAGIGEQRQKYSRGDIHGGCCCFVAQWGLLKRQ